jgi:aspartate kinase
MASIVSSLGDESVVVVVSALGSTTRLLDAALADAHSADLEGAMHHVAELERLHGVCLARLGLDGQVARSLQVLVQEGLTALTTMLRGIATTRQCTPRVRDRVLSWGEDLAREIAVRWLNAQGLSARSVPSRSVIVTTDEFGCARPLTEETTGHATALIAPLLAERHIVVIEGFVGQSTSGDVTTMGRESSNLTATLLGAALNADMVTIYTDVEGVRSGDPHEVAHTAAREHLSYTQARIAAEAGVKLLYPTMMQPAEHAHIPVRIASAFAPTGASTVIDNDATDVEPIVVGVDLGNGMHRCTVVYIDTMRFLTTVSQILASIHDCSPFDVITDAASQRADVLVPSMHATTVIDRLHTTLCLRATQDEATTR